MMSTLVISSAGHELSKTVNVIFILFIFRQVIGIPMRTNSALLLSDLFLYSYESEFLESLVRSGQRKLARSFNLRYRYRGDLIVFNNKSSWTISETFTHLN